MWMLFLQKTLKLLESGLIEKRSEIILIDSEKCLVVYNLVYATSDILHNHKRKVEVQVAYDKERFKLKQFLDFVLRCNKTSSFLLPNV